MNTVPQRMKLLREQMKAIRLARGLKQSEVATLMQVTQPTVGNVENGIRSPTIEYTLRFIHYFKEDLLALDSDFNLFDYSREVEQRARNTQLDKLCQVLTDKKVPNDKLESLITFITAFYPDFP